MPEEAPVVITMSRLEAARLERELSELACFLQGYGEHAPEPIRGATAAESMCQKLYHALN